MARDDAYRIVQESAQRAWDEGTSFRDLLAERRPTSTSTRSSTTSAYLEHLPEVFERLEALRASRRRAGTLVAVSRRPSRLAGVAVDDADGARRGSPGCRCAATG